MYRLEDVPIVPKFEESNGFYTTPARSRIMSKIKHVHTKPEWKLRRALWSMGVRYRIAPKNLPGKPDIVIRKWKLVIFVDGEFWHGYDWENLEKRIKSNRGFWIPKIQRNRWKDAKNNELLTDLGYTVLRFGSQTVEKNIGNCISTILKSIPSDYASSISSSRFDGVDW